MTTRILDRTEWPRLAGTELADALPTLPPHACIVVVEDQDRIVGCWAVVTCLHAEGLWVAPAHRQKGAVARRLLRGVGEVAASAGVRAVCVGIVDPEVEAFAVGLGGQALDGVPYVVPLERFQA